MREITVNLLMEEEKEASTVDLRSEDGAILRWTRLTEILQSWAYTNRKDLTRFSFKVKGITEEKVARDVHGETCLEDLDIKPFADADANHFPTIVIFTPRQRLKRLIQKCLQNLKPLAFEKLFKEQDLYASDIGVEHILLAGNVKDPKALDKHVAVLTGLRNLIENRIFSQKEVNLIVDYCNFCRDKRINNEIINLLQEIIAPSIGALTPAYAEKKEDKVKQSEESSAVVGEETKDTRSDVSSVSQWRIMDTAVEDSPRRFYAWETDCKTLEEATVLRINFSEHAKTVSVLAKVEFRAERYTNGERSGYRIYTQATNEQLSDLQKVTPDWIKQPLSGQSITPELPLELLRKFLPGDPGTLRSMLLVSKGVCAEIPEQICGDMGIDYKNSNDEIERKNKVLSMTIDVVKKGDSNNLYAILIKHKDNSLLCEAWNDLLIIASSKGHVDCVKVILGNCSPLSLAGIDSALQLAVQNNNENCVKVILQLVKNDILSPAINDALKLAVEDGHEKCLKVLLSDKRVNIKTRWGKDSPLRLAAMNGHVECVEMLLGHSEIELTSPASTSTNPGGFFSASRRTPSALSGLAKGKYSPHLDRDRIKVIIEKLLSDERIDNDGSFDYSSTGYRYFGEALKRMHPREQATTNQLQDRYLQLITIPKLLKPGIFGRLFSSLPPAANQLAKELRTSLISLEFANNDTCQIAIFRSINQLIARHKEKAENPGYLTRLDTLERETDNYVKQHHPEIRNQVLRLNEGGQLFEAVDLIENYSPLRI